MGYRLKRWNEPLKQLAGSMDNAPTLSRRNGQQRPKPLSGNIEIDETLVKKDTNLSRYIAKGFLLGCQF